MKLELDGSQQLSDDASARKNGRAKIHSPKYTHLALFQASEAIMGEHRIRVLPLKTHQHTVPRISAKPTPRTMKTFKGGGSKKMLRQLEAMKGQGGFPGM